MSTINKGAVTTDNTFFTPAAKPNMIAQMLRYICVLTAPGSSIMKQKMCLIQIMIMAKEYAPKDLRAFPKGKKEYQGIRTILTIESKLWDYIATIDLNTIKIYQKDEYIANNQDKANKQANKIIQDITSGYEKLCYAMESNCKNLDSNVYEKFPIISVLSHTKIIKTYSIVGAQAIVKYCEKAQEIRKSEQAKQDTKKLERELRTIEGKLTPHARQIAYAIEDEMVVLEQEYPNITIPFEFARDSYLAWKSASNKPMLPIIQVKGQESIIPAR